MLLSGYVAPASRRRRLRKNKMTVVTRGLEESIETVVSEEIYRGGFGGTYNVSQANIHPRFSGEIDTAELKIGRASCRERV